MHNGTIRLSAMRTILDMPHVRLDSLEAGKIIGCFVRLSCLVFLTFDAYPYIPGWRTVHEHLTRFWFHHIAATDLNDFNRGYMHSLKLRRTVRRPWKLIRHYSRTGRSGYEL
ncbi:hypothetical protein PMIN01_12341 [Paraphaeosphaeria minitans]|uniref:Uncharacterized protein n=1 Tax=Paraphaeosphaeria minitans TaxID=565426 RepID=A0A9P6G5Y8_9PLEO|nr:hypothetical protein PMIN01_12341 [Paraphaeosphaeria minitans]